MNLGKASLEALALLPPDGGWLTVQARGTRTLRPAGVALGVWDRIIMGWVPDSFWKPEFDEDDRRNGRSWVIFDDVKRLANGALERRFRLSPAGVALVAHCAAGGKIPRQ